MTKITKFFISKANYIAEDSEGRKYSVNIDYWNNTFKINSPNRILTKSAAKFLQRKNRVNFVEKLIQE